MYKTLYFRCNIKTLVYVRISLWLNHTFSLQIAGLVNLQKTSLAPTANLDFVIWGSMRVKLPAISQQLNQKCSWTMQSVVTDRLEEKFLVDYECVVVGDWLQEATLVYPSLLQRREHYIHIPASEPKHDTDGETSMIFQGWQGGDPWTLHVQPPCWASSQWKHGWWWSNNRLLGKPGKWNDQC